MEHWRIQPWEGAGGDVPPKIREKYFSGNYYVNSGISGKNHVKLGILLIFWANIIKFGYFDIFFAQESCKIRAFC